MQTRTARRILAFGATALVAAAACATEPGNLMKVTVNSTMHVPGMPAMTPPVHTMKVCTRKARPDPRDIMHTQKDCTATHYRQTGDSISFDIVCTGDATMTGNAVFTVHGDDVQGKIHAAMNSGGQPTTMDMTYTGTRIGDCDYTPPAAP